VPLVVVCRSASDDSPVTYDDLGDVLATLSLARPGADGRYTWHEVGTTVAVRLRVDGTEDEPVVATGPYTSFEWLSSDLLAVATEGALFFIRRDLVEHVLDVDLPEQPGHRTVHIELVNGLSIDVTAEYEHASPSP
jgi:hypothetical protein